MTLRWLVSRTVRQANDLCHRVEKILNAQRDVLAPQAIEAVSASIRQLRTAAANGSTAVEKEASNLETVANKWLKPYPNANIRENIDVILVALVVALGIRTFFLQPMAIPTGSMQPTLFGITQQDLRKDPNATIPNPIIRLFDGVARGIWYYHLVAAEDGAFRRLEPPRTILPLVKTQQLIVGERSYTIWFPPDDFERHCALRLGEVFRKGDDILKLKIMSGDRLFVDRFTYNFRRPQRGEIIIFATYGLPELTPDTHYIKRLIGLPGEKVQILDDQHVAINGRELDATTPRFENIYSFSGPPREDHYSGHLNGVALERAGRPPFGRTQFLFPDAATAVVIPPREYLVMGDNTMNSNDSRYWGPFPQDRVVGRFAFAFWPISSRFGWAVR
jgi:signal peptidase I